MDGLMACRNMFTLYRAGWVVRVGYTSTALGTNHRL